MKFVTVTEDPQLGWQSPGASDTFPVARAWSWDGGREPKVLEGTNITGGFTFLPDKTEMRIFA